MMTIVVGMVGLAVFMYVARKYKLRMNHVHCLLKNTTPRYKKKKIMTIELVVCC